jgi:hypothetical protein
MNNQLQYEVSNVDLQKRIHHAFKLVLYPDLSQYNNITQLLPNSFSILVILLESSNGNHWECVIRRNKVLTFFDSYGRGIDKEFSLISRSSQVQLGEQDHYLTNLLNNAKNQNFKIEWNNVPFQSKSPNIDTCGKHVYCVIEAFIDGLNLKEYQQVMKEMKQETGLSYDVLVCEFWENHK